jgi:hypothetical protein
MKNGVERTFYSNGQLEAEVTYKNGLPNGITRMWHPNGVLASELPVKDGIVEGTAREWNENGVLLGSYEIINGCGVMKSWYPGGKLMGEISYVNGQWNGRICTWDEDGGLIAEEFQIDGKKISKKKYIEACKDNRTLPRYEDSDAKKKIKLPSTKYRQRKTPVSDQERDKHNQFITEFRAKPNHAEARQWLADNENRNIGEMMPEAAREVVKEGYQAGATKIIAVDIQGDTTDCLIVELPSKGIARKRVFEWNNALAQSSGFDPYDDWGQKELFVFFD